MGEFLIALAQSQKKDAWLNAHPAQTEWIKDLPPFEIPQEDPLVQLSVQCFQDVLGKSPAIGPIAAWTDAAFQSIIEARPTVLMGPALPHAAHAPDERVLLDDLVTTCKVVALMLHRLLNPPAS